MHIFLLGCIIILLTGWIALLIKNNNTSFRIANLGLFTGSVLIVIPVVAVLMRIPMPDLYLKWLVPGGGLIFSLDALSAFFCLPILIVAPLAMVYGKAYLVHENNPLGKHWFFFNLLVASMLLLMVANNGLMFLLIWEVMTLSSFFLVMFDDEKQEVRSAGWTYLIASHIGAAALLIFFALLSGGNGSLQFDDMASNHQTALGIGILFFLAVFGFGVKAGFVPLHVWLPEAHPAAPSHISALMSGVMIKMGIYGILRALVLLGHPTAYMGWTLVIIGMTSGIAGVIFALAQHDLKRLLAYHSVENIGIITLGIGTGVLGLAWNIPALAILGFGGGLLHVLNHALFKSLLFFGAGAVTHITGTRNIELLGGLLKKARWTGWTFLIGAAAISGLPPFNGFISEFYLYYAGISGIKLVTTPGPIILAACILTSLALIGGLAVACFSKAFGIIFLGEPRSEHAVHTHKEDGMMNMTLFILSFLCIAIGLLAPLTLYLISAPIQIMTIWFMPLNYVPGNISLVLATIILIATSLIILAGLFYWLRRKLPLGNQETTTGTWDCGYAAPTAKMQYTASSYADPLTELFQPLLDTDKTVEAVEGYFPSKASFHSHTPDAAREKLFAPIFNLVSRVITPIRKVQHGNLNGYLLYIAITLVALLIWKAGVH